MDRLAREALAPGSPGAARVLEQFDVRDADGGVDRARLAEVVFADPAARARLEAIVHPEVRRRAAEITAAAPEGAVVVHDVPLLVESSLAGGYDVVVVVTASEATRLRRLVEGRGMSEAEARARIAAQASDAERAAVADFLIANEGSLAELDERVREVWAELVRRLGPA